MKKILLFLMSLLPFSVSAQELQYESLLDEGKVWTLQYVLSTYQPSIRYEMYELRDNTIINGIPYKKLYSKDWSDGQPEPEEMEFSGIYVGQDSQGAIFLQYSMNNHQENVKVMDFSTKVGDTYSWNQTDLVVLSVSDTIMENSADKTLRKCIRVGELCANETYYDEVVYGDLWIEGVGSAKYGLLGLLGVARVGAVCKLMQCKRQNTVIYDYKDETTFINHVERQPAKDGKFFDLQGHQLTAQPTQRGIYIRNGKKFVVSNQ